MTTKLSIITVTYQAEKLLQKTIDSIKNQTYKNIEYIIVDGGSNDGTIGLIKKNLNAISYWVSEPDKGIYDAMNKGLKAANGDFVWFINAGDEIYNNTTAEEVMKLSNNADVIYGETILINDLGKELGFRNNRPPKKLNKNSLKFGMNVCHQSFIARKNLTKPYQLNWGIAADIDWIINILKETERNKNANLTLAKFLIDGESSKNLLKSWKSRFKVLSHHYGLIPNIINHIYIVFRYLAKKVIK